MKTVKGVIKSLTLGAFTKLQETGQIFYDNGISEIGKEKEQIENIIPSIGSEIFTKHNYDPAAEAIFARSW